MLDIIIKRIVKQQYISLPTRSKAVREVLLYKTLTIILSIALYGLICFL